MQRSEVSRALCFDMRFPAGGVTGCRDRDAEGESAEVRCHADVYIQTHSCCYGYRLSRDTVPMASPDQGGSSATIKHLSSILHWHKRGFYISNNKTVTCNWIRTLTRNHVSELLDRLFLLQIAANLFYLKSQRS